MKRKLTAIAAASVVVASALSAAAAPVIIRTGNTTRVVTVTPQVSGPPVMIRDGKTLGSQVALDMDLTPIEGTRHAFTNRAGQIVIMVPNGGRLAYVPK
ncbi:hypothetical protein [Jannaschia sp. M317]|uniref:hypothetical protein n=1 Tax=Jannaschia sp. M317 TaxID=2867011 RepID=UPI0021A70BC4|nr:hypothetical protein [Jannaschia sp. M317]UWQ16997.1 hypothetical protein K3551_14005 [Jannaschia sp. M317]